MRIKSTSEIYIKQDTLNLNPPGCCMFWSITIQTCGAGHQRKPTSTYRRGRARASLVYFTQLRRSLPVLPIRVTDTKWSRISCHAQGKLHAPNNLAVCQPYIVYMYTGSEMNFPFIYIYVYGIYETSEVVCFFYRVYPWPFGRGI